MAKRKPSRHDKLGELLAGRSYVSEAACDDLRRALAPISKSYLRKMLRSENVPLAPLVEGVRQDSFDQLERTLLALQAEYERSPRERAAACRRLVIEAKNHARWTTRKTSDETKGLEKDEMILWMLTWLENPAVFDTWLRLRKRNRSA